MVLQKWCRRAKVLYRYMFFSPCGGNTMENHGLCSDYIVKFTDGQICICDTKSGFIINQPETKEKLRSLHRYINKQNGNAWLRGSPLKLFGGIEVRGPDGVPERFYIK